MNEEALQIAGGVLSQGHSQSGVTRNQNVAILKRGVGFSPNILQRPVP